MTVCDRCGEKPDVRILRVEAMTHGIHGTVLSDPKEPGVDVCEKCIEVLRDVVGAFFHAKYFHPKGDRCASA